MKQRNISYWSRPWCACYEWGRRRKAKNNLKVTT